MFVTFFSMENIIGLFVLYISGKTIRTSDTHTIYSLLVSDKVRHEPLTSRQIGTYMRESIVPSLNSVLRVATHSSPATGSTRFLSRSIFQFLRLNKKAKKTSFLYPRPREMYIFSHCTEMLFIH